MATNRTCNLPGTAAIGALLALVLLLACPATQAQASRSCGFKLNPQVGIYFVKVHVTDVSCDRGVKILSKYQRGKRLPRGWSCSTDAKYQIYCRNGRARVRGYFGGDTGRQPAPRGRPGHPCDDVSLAPATDWVAVNVRAVHVKCGAARKVVRDVNYDRSTSYRCSYRPGPSTGLTSTLIRCADGRRLVRWKQY